MIGVNWKARALAAEDALREARTTLDAIEAIQANRTALVSITTSGRMRRFGFVRNGKMHIIETYGALSDDVPGWKRDLLE